MGASIEAEEEETAPEYFATGIEILGEIRIF
jgi:hypothetical protein